MENQRPSSLIDNTLLEVDDLENDNMSSDRSDEEMLDEDLNDSRHLDHMMDSLNEMDEFMNNQQQRKRSSQSNLPSPLNQNFKELLMTNDHSIKKAEEIIEEAIQKELKRTKGKEEEIEMDVPNDVRKVLDLSKVPKLSSIIEEMGESNESEDQQCVFSSTEEAKIENAIFLPKRNDNSVTLAEKSNYVGRRHEELNERPESDEVVLQVAIYHPVRNTKVQEFLVLGRQCLTDLRDAISCLSDEVLEAHVTPGHFTKSAYFFIENIFYNDMRYEGNVEYSSNIVNWLAEFDNLDETKTERGEPAAKYTSLKMEDIRFYDLSIRLNEPYIYCHQGNCMHYIVFTDMRLINEKKDVMNVYAYPIRSYQAKPKRRKCGVCEIYQAKWVTYGDKYTSDDPSFFCDSCYRQFHYDHFGKILYQDYEVYRYYHE